MCQESDSQEAGPQGEALYTCACFEFLTKSSLTRFY